VALMATALPPNCAWMLPGILGICIGPPPPPIPGPDLPMPELPMPGPDLPGLDLPDTPPQAVPGAQVEARAIARTRDDVCTVGCDACVAASTGFPQWVSYRDDPDAPLAGTAERGYAYQHFVCRLPHEPVARRIMEWQFAGYSWDGIEVVTCTLLEAKYGYDEFLEDDWQGGLPRLKTWAIKAGIQVFVDLVTQAGEQAARIAPFRPEVSLRWVFSHQRPMIYFVALLNNGSFVDVETEWRPMAGG
jgi:hypothetical protein